MCTSPSGLSSALTSAVYVTVPAVSQDGSVVETVISVSFTSFVNSASPSFVVNVALAEVYPSSSLPVQVHSGAPYVRGISVYVAVYVVFPVTVVISGSHPANSYLKSAVAALVGVSAVYSGV